MTMQPQFIHLRNDIKPRKSLATINLIAYNNFIKMDQKTFYCSPSLYITLIFLILCRGISGSTFTVVNKCGYTVWPGVLGNTRLDSTGFQLTAGSSRSFQVPPNWSGRLWGRAGCTFDSSTGQGTCTSGDCGSNQIECNGKSASPPATLAEFTIGSGTQDFYDVSLVDGYNLPMIVEPSGGSGSCLATGCITDLNQRCPAELRTESGEGCKSACEAFGNPEYCCSGAFGTPSTCRPSVYSEMFKAACPKSYSYAYDDATSTFTCMGADYTITFCPTMSSQKSARDSSPTTNPINGTVSGSGDQVPRVDNGTWLPNFLTGDSSRTLSFSTLISALIASVISFIVLCSPSIFSTDMYLKATNRKEELQEMECHYFNGFRWYLKTERVCFTVNSRNMVGDSGE